MRLRELKQHNKELASKLREQTRRWREAQREQAFEEYWKWYSESGMYSTARIVFRHRHIAYCLLRGRKYEEIENSVRPGNEPNWDTIYKIMEKYNGTEDVCTSKKGSVEVAADCSGESCGSTVPTLISRLAKKVGLG